MVTVDLLRESFAAIVESHKADVTFYIIGTSAKDRGDITFPACLWIEVAVTTSVATDENLIPVTSITFSCAFLDEYATSRGRTAVANAFERMEAIGRQCWIKYHQTYIEESDATWQGERVDLAVETSPTFTPIVDHGPENVAGVLMEVTLSDLSTVECVDTYFD